MDTKHFVIGGLFIGLATMAAGCVVTPRDHDEYREGYYDRDHHRYYHDHAWHECDEHDEHCADRY